MTAGNVTDRTSLRAVPPRAQSHGTGCADSGGRKRRRVAVGTMTRHRDSSPRVSGRPCRTCRRHFRRQPQVPEDPRGHGGRTPRARRAVAARHTADRPARRPRMPAASGPPKVVRPNRTTLRRHCSIPHRSRLASRRPRYHVGPPRGVRRQDAVIKRRIDPRPWHEHRQPLEERRRFESDMSGAVGPRMAKP